MAVDGSLKFDTKVDTNGFKKGTDAIQKSSNSMITSFKKLGAAIGIAFGVSAIIGFAKASIQASNNIQNAMIGLKSIVEGQGRSFEDANSFIQEYISDGLIPATEAVTAYKNLAMRGYDDGQIKATLEALKNSSAFGRSAALSMGEAVRSATEGLRNENSILVDNAGVTKNVSMMWADYAKSIGVGVQSLTKQQKIQAEVLGIMEETRFQTGDAAKVADTYSGSILRLQFNLNNMKIAFGNFLKPIISAVLPVINSAITAFTKFFNIIAQVSALLFGKQVFASGQAEKQEQAISGAADNQKALTGATKKANAEAKKQLYSFDEIQKLSKETADNAGGTGGADVATGGVDTSFGGVGGEIGGNITISPNVQAIVDKIKAMFEPLKNINLDNLKVAFDNLKIALEPFTSTIFEGLKWAWFNLFVPFSKWAIEDAVPKFLDVLASALDAVSSAIEPFKPLGKWLWDKFLKPMSEFVGTFVTEFLNELGSWMKKNTGPLSFLATVVASFGVAWVLVNGAIAIWNVIGLVATGITTAFGAAVAFLTSPIGLTILAIGAIIAVVVLLIKHWDTVKAVAIKCWEGIKAVWGVVAPWIGENVVKPIGGFFASLWEAIVYAAKFAFWSIQVGAIGMVNFVTSAINTMIKGILLPFNLLISAMNLLPGVKIPNLRFEIPKISLPSIPKLAQGAVIPPNREFMAVLGDQKHGTNIETPLATMIEAFKIANAENGGGDNRNITVVLEVNEREFGRAVYNANNGERQRVGLRLSGVY